MGNWCECSCSCSVAAFALSNQQVSLTFMSQQALNSLTEPQPEPEPQTKLTDPKNGQKRRKRADGGDCCLIEVQQFVCNWEALRHGGSKPKNKFKYAWQKPLDRFSFRSVPSYHSDPHSHSHHGLVSLHSRAASSIKRYPSGRPVCSGFHIHSMAGKPPGESRAGGGPEHAQQFRLGLGFIGIPCTRSLVAVASRSFSRISARKFVVACCCCLPCCHAPSYTAVPLCCST